MEFGASTGNRMEWAFQQPHINWTESQVSEPINSAWYDLDPFSRDTPLVQTFWKGNLTELASDCETIRVRLQCLIPLQFKIQPRAASRTSPDCVISCWLDIWVPVSLQSKGRAEWLNGHGVLHVQIGTFYGMTARLFLNPYLREKLLGMGLRPETAFGCAMDFLFGEPVHEVHPVPPKRPPHLSVVPSLAVCPCTGGSSQHCC